jgi:hypothetical protein
VSRVGRKDEEKRRRRSRVCGKVDNRVHVVHFSTDHLGQKSEKRGKAMSQPNQKSPVMNGEKK